MKKSKKQNGFTLGELLIVVAIIGVLVAISIPVFTSQLEKSREAVDAANIRSAYAQVMSAVLLDETEGNDKVQYKTFSGRKRLGMEIQLKQKIDYWTNQPKSDGTNGDVAGDPLNSIAYIINHPTPSKSTTVRVYYGEYPYAVDEYGVIVEYVKGYDRVDQESMDIITSLSEEYGIQGNNGVIHCNDTSDAAKKIKELLKDSDVNGFESIGANSWTLYYCDQVAGANVDGKGITGNVIYWSQQDINKVSIGKKVPVIGYSADKDGYDIYAMTVTNYTAADGTTYKGLQDITKSVANTAKGSMATYQYDNYSDALAAYEYLARRMEEDGGLQSGKSVDTYLKEGGFKT